MGKERSLEPRRSERLNSSIATIRISKLPTPCRLQDAGEVAKPPKLAKGGRAAASDDSFCSRRQIQHRLGESAFKPLRGKTHSGRLDRSLRMGLWMLAIDGPTITPSRTLARRRNVESDGTHHPQDKVVVSGWLQDRMPTELDRFGHGKERVAFVTYLVCVAEGDVIAYDHEYPSFTTALAHRQHGLDFIFGIKKAAAPCATSSCLGRERPD